jgi:hypothetical protein
VCDADQCHQLPDLDDDSPISTFTTSYSGKRFTQESSTYTECPKQANAEYGCLGFGGGNRSDVSASINLSNKGM